MKKKKIKDFFLKKCRISIKIFIFRVILLLSGVYGMKNEKSFQITKEGLQGIISLICIFLSFWVLNSYLMNLSGISITKNFSIWLSNTFFSMSWIFFLIGFIYLFQGIYRRIAAIVLFFVFSIITCLESISFTICGRYQFLNRFDLSTSKVLESMSEEFILCFFISFILLLAACLLLKKIKVQRRNQYQLAFFLLTILFLFGICRGIAYYSMGSQVIYKSGKESKDFKTIYLKHEKGHLDFKISGLYDFTIREWYYGIKNQIQKTDEYLRK